MNICCVLVTKGDVDLSPIIQTLPFDEVVVWDNSQGEDLAVYGRYEAIIRNRADLIAVQDDDCIVPWEALLAEYREGERLCNMDVAKQTEYGHSSLIGWGAIFPREDPFKAFLRYAMRFDTTGERFRRTCDVVFTALCPFRRVDLGREDLSYWNAPGRMHTSGGHYGERAEVTAECLTLPRLSVIVPTTGRDTLQAAVDSCRDADEIVVIDDGGQATRPVSHHRTEFVRVQGAGREAGDVGYTARTRGMEIATGTHLAFMDDDDVFTPSAIDTMREHAADVPVVFRMDDPLHGVIWRDPVLRYANVSSQMIVVPNDAERLGTWEPYENDPGKGGDFVFLRGCIEKIGEPVWREEIVCTIRPHERRTVSVVTPWLGHHELAADYAQALLAGPPPSEAIIVDNGDAPEIPGCSRLTADENLGFARGSNAGLENASGEIVVFLNNDIAPTKRGWLHSLTSVCEPGVLVGAKLRYDRHGDVDGMKLPYLDGWCIAGMREDLLELGGFDETLQEPAYFSDNDLCFRARAAGMTLREVEVGLRHKLNQTAKDDPAAIEPAFLANFDIYASRVRELLAEAVAA